MFKKLQKKNKIQLEENNSEEKIEIKQQVQKKRVGKWIENPSKSGLSAEKIEFVIKDAEKQETNTKENFDVPLNIFTEVYGRDFNATFESIAKVMHKSEVDSENYSSNEELENNEMGSDVDSEASDAEKSHLIRLNNDRPVVTIKSLENFLNEKLSDIKIHKEMQHSRLEKIISLQRDSKIILESLHKQANQNLE